MSKPKTIMIDDVSYVRADTVPEVPAGTRAVVVVDRGWVFAGDVTEENGRIRLDRAVHVRSWKSVGFDGMVVDPSTATIKPMNAPVDLPADAEIFRVPVEDTWGL